VRSDTRVVGRSGLRVGVLGVGYWGSKHLRVLGGLADVDSVVAIDERLPSIPGMAGLIERGEGFTCLADALPAIDALVIATPPSSHHVLGHQAIAAGKHVLIEKPLAVRTEDAQGLIEAADAAGVTLMVGHTFEHNDAVKMLRELVQRQELGELYYLDCARLNLGLYQTDVNVIHDLAPHDISIANFVLGQAPTSVHAWGSRHVHADHEDVAHLRLEYASLGVRVNVHVSWLHPHKVRQIVAVGAKKMAVYDDAAAEKIRIHDKSALASAGGRPPMAYHEGDVVSPYLSFREPLAVQDKHFVECIRGGLVPSTDGASGLAVVSVLEAAQLSLAERREVLLEEVGLETIAADATSAVAV
jgi:predicted dehydrogenase